MKQIKQNRIKTIFRITKPSYHIPSEVVNHIFDLTTTLSSRREIKQIPSPVGEGQGGVSCSTNKKGRVKNPTCEF